VTQYLVAIHHPDDFDPPQDEDEAQRHRDIDALNREMKTAGIVVFVGGLHSPKRAKTIRLQTDGKTLVTDGPFIETKEHIGGFWILDVATPESALEWGRKAAVACRAPTEVRPFHWDADPPPPQPVST
jgi:hypothetical protein